MRYLVREPGKTGGTEYETADDAVQAALDWYDQTGIACEIFIMSRSAFDMPRGGYIRARDKCKSAASPS